MFTGIITGIGAVTKATPIQAGQGYQLLIEAPKGFLDDVGLGDSIALNGACMTVTTLDKTNNHFTIDISLESLNHTAELNQDGKKINLEKAMRMDERLGGHLVSGHVDGVGTVQKMEPVGESWQLDILIPATLGHFLAYKGSITINGVSLTVNTVQDLEDKQTRISINLIPHTVANTTLGLLKSGSKVNLEVDLIARYVERMLTATGSEITPGFVKAKQ